MSLLLALTSGVIPPEPPIPPVIPASFAGGGGGRGMRHKWELHKLFEDIFATGIPAKDIPELYALEKPGQEPDQTPAAIVRRVAARTIPEPQYRLLALSLELRLEIRAREMELEAEEEYTVISLLLH